MKAFVDAAAASPRMFWLDGGGAHFGPGSSQPWAGTRSVIGVLADDDVSLTFDAATRVVTRHRDGRAETVGHDIFEVLEDECARDGGDPEVSWVGYFGYACRTDLPGRPASDGPGSGADPGAGVPDAIWMRVRNPTLQRHADSSPGRPRRRTSGEAPLVPGWYAEAFDEVQRQLRLGNSYEANLTYREYVDSPKDPVDAYLDLRRLNPAPYSGYLQHHGVHLLSSSPERFATIDRHRMLEAKPIKGTTPRGTTPEEDAANAHRLATDPKYRAENLMIVDLLRNDLSTVCDPGTVTVPALMQVESYESVHQLVSTIRGRLAPAVGTVAALRALFPAGSMTGAPKRRTMEIIDGIEATPRGAYAGAFGWLSGDGRADLAVVIRSLVVLPRGGSTASAGRVNTYGFGTGGGITVRSTVEEEYAETRWKAALLRAALT